MDYDVMSQLEPNNNERVFSSKIPPDVPIPGFMVIRECFLDQVFDGDVALSLQYKQITKDGVFYGSYQWLRDHKLLEVYALFFGPAAV